MEKRITYLNKNYSILAAEQEFIVHPAALGLLPLTNSSLQSTYSVTFHVDQYHLILDQLAIKGTESGNIKQYTFPERIVPYNGAVLIGADIVKEYCMKGIQIDYFSYKNVYELLFEDGILITSVDQSRAMLKIRRNIDAGLRELSNSRDQRCIKRFLNSSLIGDYKPFILKTSRLKYLKETRNDYPATGYAKPIKADTMCDAM